MTEEQRNCDHDPSTELSDITLEWDGDGLYVETFCKKCGLTGTFGAIQTSDVSWEEIDDEDDD